MIHLVHGMVISIRSKSEYSWEYKMLNRMIIHIILFGENTYALPCIEPKFLKC
jgi:hypothetical protein